MRSSVFGRTLRDGRRALTGWTVGVVAVTALYAGSYKSIGATKAAVLKNYPDSIKQALNMEDFGTPAGYLGSTVFGILLAVLFSAYALTAATRAVAGEEESGRLDLLLAHPVSRWRVLLERFAAIVAALAGLGVLVLAVLLALRGPAGLGAVGADGLAAATLQLVLLGVCTGGLVLLVSAGTGRRGLSLGAGVVIALFGYLANSFLPQVKGLHWIRNISPFHWFDGNDPLVHGLSASGCGLAIGVAAVSVALGGMLFARRDVNV